MPGFDGTGPAGYGPMTGGGRGYCAPGYAGVYRRGFGGGFGYGRGRGYGRGWFGRGFGAQVPPAAFGPAGAGYRGAYGPVNSGSELDMLRAEAESMRGALEDINQRIQELEKDSAR
jgi:hypothetical protein